MATIVVLLVLLMSLPAAAEIEKDVRFIHSIQQDSEGNALRNPTSLAADPKSGEIYIVDSGNSRIIVCNESFFPIYSLDKSKGISSPSCLALDTRGNLYIAQSEMGDSSSPVLSVLSPTFRHRYDILLSDVSPPEPWIPIRLATDGEGHLYLAGQDRKGVLVLDGKGKLLRRISPRETVGEEEKTVHISDVDVARDGTLFMVSPEAGRVFVYTAGGAFLYKFGQKGGSTGKFSQPRGIALDERASRLYVVDYMRHTVSAYATDGEFLFEFGGKGWGPGWFQYPSDVLVDARQRIYVADTFNNRIQVFTTKRPTRPGL